TGKWIACFVADIVAVLCLGYWGAGVMARDVVLRIGSSGRLVPAIGTPLIPATYSVQCAISALTRMISHRESSISAKAAPQLTAFQPAVLPRCARFDCGSGDSATAVGPAPAPAGRPQPYHRSRAVRHFQGRRTRPDHLATTDQFAWTT